MLYYQRYEDRAKAIQVFTDDSRRKHICGFWFNDFEPKQKWQLYFPATDMYFNFDDEETLKTFLELHWEEYRGEMY